MQCLTVPGQAELHSGPCRQQCKELCVQGLGGAAGQHQQGDVMGVKGKEENRLHSCHRYLAVLLQQDGSAIINLKFPMVF